MQQFCYSFTCISLYTGYIFENYLVEKTLIWLWQTFDKNHFTQAKGKDAWQVSQRGLPVNRTTNQKIRKLGIANQSQPLSLTHEQSVLAGSRRMALAEATGTTVYLQPKRRERRRNGSLGGAQNHVTRTYPAFCSYR